MENEFTLTGKDLGRVRNLLLLLVDILNEAGVVYHLEGGTLLGIVRDGDLLPWDHDFDLSIMRSELPKLQKCIWPLRRRLWRVGVRKYEMDGMCWIKDQIRLFRISNRKNIQFWEKGKLQGDVFVKELCGDHVYWRAKRKIMRVDKKFYESYGEIEYFGRKVKVPNFYEDYLEQKYGDWRVPVKEWDCATDELTIFGEVPEI
jgi:lipopolysaccharide cholinephosphotransferase